MIQESILLVGAGSHARACIDVIEQEERFIVKGLVGHSNEKGKKILDYSVLGMDADIPELIKDCKNILIATGQIKTPETRIRLFRSFQNKDCSFPVIISPHSYVSSHAKIGCGTIIMHGCIVNAGARIGENCIINSQALIEHDVAIEDHCHISTGAKINGGAKIGLGTFVGSNSVVRENIYIGERCIISMGQNVYKECETGKVYSSDKN